MAADAQVSTTSTAVIGRPFPKGVSGNPGGRPKGIVSYLRDQTQDGKELVDRFLAIFRGAGEFQDARLRDRISAGEWLADRGWGKATLLVGGDPDQGPVQFALGDEELRALCRFVFGPEEMP